MAGLHTTLGPRVALASYGSNACALRLDSRQLHPKCVEVIGSSDAKLCDVIGSSGERIGAMTRAAG